MIRIPFELQTIRDEIAVTNQGLQRVMECVSPTEAPPAFMLDYNAIIYLRSRIEQVLERIQECARLAQEQKEPFTPYMIDRLEMYGLLVLFFTKSLDWVSSLTNMKPVSVPTMPASDTTLPLHVDMALSRWRKRFQQTVREDVEQLQTNLSQYDRALRDLAGTTYRPVEASHYRPITLGSGGMLEFLWNATRAVGDAWQSVRVGSPYKLSHQTRWALQNFEQDTKRDQTARHAEFKQRHELWQHTAPLLRAMGRPVPPEPSSDNDSVSSLLQVRREILLLRLLFTVFRHGIKYSLSRQENLAANVLFYSPELQTEMPLSKWFEQFGTDWMIKILRLLIAAVVHSIALETEFGNGTF